MRLDVKHFPCFFFAGWIRKQRNNTSARNANAATQIFFVCGGCFFFFFCRRRAVKIGGEMLSKIKMNPTKIKILDVFVALRTL